MHKLTSRIVLVIAGKLVAQDDSTWNATAQGEDFAMEGALSVACGEGNRYCCSREMYEALSQIAVCWPSPVVATDDDMPATLRCPVIGGAR